MKPWRLIKYFEAAKNWLVYEYEIVQGVPLIQLNLYYLSHHKVSIASEIWGQGQKSMFSENVSNGLWSIIYR